jgi:protein-tyrosine phosphatase
MVKVLFVCLGNICRSPMAEGVFRYAVQAQGLERHIFIDSAGTHAYHLGEPPDPRAQTTAARYGADISGLRGRQATARDMEEFHYVLAMDRENLTNLQRLCPPELRHKPRLFLQFAADCTEDEVPDPYFGGMSGFDRVLDLIRAASEGLLAEIQREHLQSRRKAE